MSFWSGVFHGINRVPPIFTYVHIKIETKICRITVYLCLSWTSEQNEFRTRGMRMRARGEWHRVFSVEPQLVL